MNTTDFKNIPLSEIHPDKNQPRKFFDDAALKELTASVKDKGVLQPIMVRPNGKGYILVCGERRLKASIAAGLKDVPAVIRNLSDQEALEIQFIENIQRDDVHPMDEATTFKSMLESKVKPYTIADIAAKINKPEKFVAHRLSLNSLIPELQNDFWKGKFLIGHAILFSKLSPEDQKTCSKDCVETVYIDREKSARQYKSVNEVNGFIQRNIMRVLSSAPFKKEDPTLNPEMGPCTTCPFRSGNNPTLFDEVKETDRCFKPGCFNIKLENWTLKKVESILSEQPEIRLLVNSNSKILKQIVDLATKYKVPLLKEYHDFSSYSRTGYKEVKGLWVNTNEIGKTEKIFIQDTSKAAKSEKTTDGKPTANAIAAEISGIKERTKRAAELDDEKVWARIHMEVLSDSGAAHDTLYNSKKLSKIDTAALLMSLYEKTSSEYSGDICKIFGIKTQGYLYREQKAKLVEKLLTATPEQVNRVSRLFITSTLDSASGSHSANPGQGLLKQVAEQYYKDKIKAFEDEQLEKRTKREERAAQRIKALQDQKKEKPTKKDVVGILADESAKGIKKVLAKESAPSKQNQKRKSVKK